MKQKETLLTTQPKEEKISLNLKDEELKPLEVDLKPNYTSLSIKSEPQGAKVFIDNNYVGTTPYVNDKIGFGNYSITLQKDLYMDYREDILIGSDAKIEKTTTFSPPSILLPCVAIAFSRCKFPKLYK